jgi:uncharacterized protein (DUF1697 family)
VRHVVLLRGINLGSRNRVSMKELRPALEDAGFEDVTTLLQSGNVVLTAGRSTGAVEQGVRDVLIERFGLDVDVLVRDAAAWRKVVAGNPFDGVATDGRKQFVVFCSEKPKAAAIPEAEPPEQLVAKGRELHVWSPQGMRDGKVMTTLTRRPPAPVTTFRNWNTVEKLAELL